MLPLASASCAKWPCLVRPACGRVSPCPAASPGFVAAAAALIDFEQAIEARVRPVEIGQRSGAERMRHDHRFLPGCVKTFASIHFHRFGGRLSAGLPLSRSISRSGAPRFRNRILRCPAGPAHAVLVGVDADEYRAVRHQVDGLLHGPPLVVAQAVGPFSAGDFVVVGGAEPVELRGVHGIAISVEYGSIDAAMAADVGVAMGVAHQQMIGLAAGGHGGARPWQAGASTARAVRRR